MNQQSKRELLAAEWDAINEKILDYKEYRLLSDDPDAFRRYQEGAPILFRREFDRQTEIEQQIREIDVLLKG